MAKISRFEDLIAWQKARVLTKAIYEITNYGKFLTDYGLRDQIRRAAVSVMSNIAEGFERHTLNEFFRYLAIAKASCAEVRSQLYIAFDVVYITETDFTRLINATQELSRIITGLQATINKNP